MDHIYSFLAPIAIGLVVIEVIMAIVFKKRVITFADSVINLGTGMFNQCVNMLILFLVLVSYGYLYDNFNTVTWEKGFLYYFILLLFIDFLFYWYHRFNHEINFLWAAHSPHHSSEEFNYTVGARASITQRLFSFTFFWPLCFIGFEPMDIYMMTGIHLMIGFTHHTRLIPKLGPFIEYIFNTPSHHRVHHGTNARYLDKNYAEVFIIWDRMFGTFQEELDEDPVRYGILRHPMSNSMITINFHFWAMLAKDFIETKSWWNKIRLWFMPLGWRPDDVSYRSKVKPIEYGTPRAFITTAHKNSKFYIIIQVAICLVLMYATISAKFNIPSFYKVVFSFVLLYALESWKYLLDNTKKYFTHVTLSTICMCLCFLKIGEFQNVITPRVATYICIILIINLISLYGLNFLKKNNKAIA